MTILFDVGIDDDNYLNTKLKRPKIFSKYIFVYIRLEARHAQERDFIFLN